MSRDDRRHFGGGVVAGVVLGLALAAFAVWLLAVLDDDADSGTANARELIHENYFKEISDEKLDEFSIRGMVDDLKQRFDDKFSHYFTAEELEEFETSSKGEFEGIGLAVNEAKQGLRVALVYPDTPAERAGISEGDLIVEVDGESIAGVSSEVSTARIKGPPGTEVELRVIAANSGKPRLIMVERASVRIPAVEGALRRVDGRKVAYVRFGSFSEGAHGELRDEIERLYRRGAEGLIIDLRGNGGGLLNEAILSASNFVEEGVVVSTKSRTQGDTDYEAVGGALDPKPTVVLVNRDSASAAEILTAALQVYDLAEVVGTRTYGKGTFQEVIPLEAGGAVDLTIGQYLTADGTSILGEGVKPDVRAEDDPKTEDADEGLDAALDVVGGGIANAAP